MIRNNIGNSKIILEKIKQFLNKKNISTDNYIIEQVNERINGKNFSFSDHIEGLIFSLLTKQRPWKPILENKENIRGIFFNFDKDKILSTDWRYFGKELKAISCGNRSINGQMETLKENINTFEKIELKFGSIDNFFLAYPPRTIAEMLSNYKSEYKLKQVGFALALEYIRNVGIDASKPDLHLCRIVAGNRLKLSDKEIVSDKETFDIVVEMSKKSNYTQAEIDSVLWHFCSDGFGNICNSKPKCSECVIAEFCNRG